MRIKFHNMGTYGRVRREKRACLGNDSEPRGAPWKHKIVTTCVTFLRARGQSCGAKHIPDAPCVMCHSWGYMCPSRCAIRALHWARNVPLRAVWASAWLHGASGETSSRTEKAVPGKVVHREEICAIVMMWHFVTFWHFLLDRFLRYVMDIMFRRCVKGWFSASINA